MGVFYLPATSLTLASALRAALEEQQPDAFVACTRLHPLDDFLQVDAPSEAAVRAALLLTRERVRAARVVAAAGAKTPRAAPEPAA